MAKSWTDVEGGKAWKLQPGIYNPVPVQYSGSRAPHKRVKLITHGLARGHNDSLYGFEGRLADLSCDRDIPRIPY